MTRPYYQDDNVTLYHADCLTETHLWTAAAALVTDPPYGMKYVSNFGKVRTRPILGDGSLHARDTALAAWGEDKPALVFGTWRLPRPAATKQLLIWDKGKSPGMGNISIPWGPSHEEIYVLGNGFTGKRGPSVLQAKPYAAASLERPSHPTPKPVALMRQLLVKCPPGIIADPFAGSGATLLAAAQMGRTAVGVELDEEYCELIANRLTTLQAQGVPLPETTGHGTFP